MNNPAPERERIISAKARHGGARQVPVWHGQVGYGMARRGLVWTSCSEKSGLYAARLGSAWRGMACFGQARRGGDRRGTVRQGEARHGLH